MVSIREDLRHFSIDRIVSRIKSGENVNYFNIPLSKVFGFKEFNDNIGKLSNRFGNPTHLRISYEEETFVVLVFNNSSFFHKKCCVEEIICIIYSLH